jgi:tRNA/tmRNA/rRNA uracil-C5-methylase (TrmA/RlmC/RlmD family)
MENNHTVEIEKIVSGGLGIARVDEKPVFVPFTLPGEKVNISITQGKKSFAFGKVEKWMETSSRRIEPACPLFGMCGGCQFQMTDYETQLEIKKGIIQESVNRIGKMDVPVNDSIPSDSQFHYRNKGSFQVFGQEEIGYCKPRTTIPFAIEDCPIMEKAINEKIRNFLSDPQEREKLQGMKALVIRSNNHGETINSTIKRDAFTEKVAGLDFMVDVDTFFQVNRTIVPKWLSYIQKLMATHKVGKGLLDLYCGVGIIGQYLAPEFDRVIGMEINKRLVENGNAVLERNGITNAEFMVADASKFYDYGFDYDTVVINPPRKGISYRMIQTLVKTAPKVVIYSSCNPDTFARDIRQLSEGGYRIDEIQPFDMFPQTQHSEVVAVLYRD